MSLNEASSEVKVFDTTMRDGEQTPGVSLTPSEKLEIARHLAKMNVDVIEAGFPITSQGDFEAVSRISEEVRGPTIAGLCRTRKKDIESCAEALEEAESARIHIVIATSDIHVEKKLQTTKSDVVKDAVQAVEFAKTFQDNVEFSAEDASRTQPEFLSEIFEATIDAGATTINIPDTVGYAVPDDFAELVNHVRETVPNIDEAEISVHCHNDLGMATANSLAAVKAGARQVEVAVNGIGERAGNTSLEETVMALKTRRDFFNLDVNVDTTEIAPVSRLVSSLTGMDVQKNKAIIGQNAFAHESGIHQDGVLKDERTYEIMRPQDIGLTENQIVLGKHSGRHAFRERLKELGYHLTDEAVNDAFKRFKDLADKKDRVYDADLEAIIKEEVSRQIDVKYELEYLHVLTGNTVPPTATVKVRVGEELRQNATSGDGPVDAVYSALDGILVDGKPELKDYSIRSVTQGQDALGEVTVRVQRDGITVNGHSTSTDILEASAEAYLDAVNRAIYRKRLQPEEEKPKVSGESAPVN